MVLLAAGLLSAFVAPAAHAQITTVFYILLENRNWTNGGNSGAPSQIQGNAAAPYLNAITNPANASATGIGSSAQVSYCSAYHNVLATATGTPPSIHPSEPNYVWMENGSNLSKADDNDPYGSGASVQQIYNYALANPSLTTQNLSGLIQAAGLTWKSYSEGTNLQNSNGANINTAGGNLTNTPVPANLWTVPLVSFSGTNNSYTNVYNHSHQWNFAAKHTGQLFFTQTNGSTVNTANTSVQNVEAPNYPPLEQLQTDLNNNTCANYNVITPDQYNDMHTALSSPGFTYTVTAKTPLATGLTYTGDLAQVAQGDNFCQIIVPEIMASPVYQAGHAAIIIWTDETEGTPQNTFGQTLTEIAISPLCKGSAYNSTLNYTHSSDIATMQRIFGLTANTPSGYLNDAANYSNSSGALAGSALGYGTGIAQDLSDLFTPGTIPASIPGLNLAAGGLSFNRKTGAYTQNVTVTNTLATAYTDPIYLVVANLTNATLTNKTGTTVNNQAGSPYVSVSPSGLAAGASATVTLQYSVSGTPSSTMSVIHTAAQP